MPRIIEKHQTKQSLKISDEALSRFASWISLEVDDAIASQKFQAASWRECLKRYEGVPRLEQRNVPIQNAPNIEVTIGAIASDTINAQAIDLIFNTSPLLTIRPKPKDKNDDTIVERAKALQVFANHIASSPDVDLRNAAETAILDDVQLGTGLFYVPFTERLRKTKTAKVTHRSPRVRAVCPEDFIVPGGTRQTIDDMPICGIRMYHRQTELMDLARSNKWDISHFHPLGATGWIRQQRETLGRHSEGILNKGAIYDVMYLFCYFDIDEDGYDEDLFVVYNHSGRSIGAYSYNTMDRRPFAKMVYQRRPHMFYGLGVLEMLGPFEEKITDIHNYATLNILLANSRLWVGDGSAPKDPMIYPGKVITGLDSTDSFQPLQMADVYNSIWQDQMMVMQLANQRVGINEGVSPQNIPNRTPGITTMSMLQQVNRRFAPAFDSMRIAIADAIKQCLYRYQERLLAGDQAVTASIYQIMGWEAGNHVIDALKNEEFDEQVDLELTAASADINREADRQNSLLLTNILAQYYQRTLELVSISANPQTPPEVRDVANKIVGSVSEVIERTIRTFDQVRDPMTFVVEVNDTLESLERDGGSPQMAMQQLVASLLENQGQQQDQLSLPERTMA
jgi:hypothetical protein